MARFRLLPLIALFGMCACAGDRAPAETGARSGQSRAGTTMPATRPATGPVAQQTFSGTLRGGMMAIGGEHTGWVLEADGAAGGIELDVSRVAEQARRLEGQRVTVSGRFIQKEYVERGPTRILRVESLVAAPRRRPAAAGEGET